MKVSFGPMLIWLVIRLSLVGFLLGFSGFFAEDGGAGRLAIVPGLWEGVLDCTVMGSRWNWRSRLGSRSQATRIYNEASSAQRLIALARRGDRPVQLTCVVKATARCSLLV
jgi:hypothetical protein